MREAYRNGAALLVAVAVGYALAGNARLSAPPAADEPAWSLPEPESPDLAAARQRLDELAPWKDRMARAGGGNGEASGDGASGNSTGDAASWAFHGVIERRGRRVALIATGSGEIRRIGPSGKLPGGERVTAIHADWLAVAGGDGERRVRLYEPQ